MLSSLVEDCVCEEFVLPLKLCANKGPSNEGLGVRFSNGTLQVGQAVHTMSNLGQPL